MYSRESLSDPDAPRIKLALDTARGVEYLHWRRVIHFDIKADNIMTDLKDPKRPTGKIGDLGLAKLKSSTYVSCNMRGTLPWMAPELFPQSRDIQQEVRARSVSCLIATKPRELEAKTCSNVQNPILFASFLTRSRSREAKRLG